MKKFLALFLFVLMSFAYAGAYAGEKEIRQLMQSNFPSMGTIDHVAKSGFLGLYEITTAGQLYYVDENAQYLIDGHIIETGTKRDLTAERKRKLFAVEFDKLPLDLAVKRVKGNGKRKMAYFTDPNCSFCKRLEKEIEKINDVTLYIYMYPIFPGSDEIVRNVRCAKDPVKAWDNFMLKGNMPTSANCETTTDKVVALGQKLRINGTPNLIFANGMQTPGYLPAEELEKNLNESSAAKN